MTDKIFWRTPSSSYPAIKYGHDPYGNVTSEWTYGLNNTTTTEYETDTYTYPWRITNCLNQVVTKTWDYRFGKEDLVTDPNGNKTDFTYDSFGRIANIANKDASNNVVGYSANDYSNYDQTDFPRYITTSTLESGGISTGSYIEKEEHFDGLDRSIKAVTDGKNEDGTDEEIITKIQYDEMGRKKKVEGPYFASEEGTGNYYSETTSYDKLGRVIKVESPDGGPDPITTSYNYPNFFTTEITDPDGKKKTEKRDHLERIIEVIEHAGDVVENPVPQTTGYEYNAAGDMTKVTNALSIDTSIGYDLRGLKTSMDDPDMGDWTYTYDGNGNLWTQTDAKGDIITFGYDGLNRILTKTYTIHDSQETEATRNVAYTYDQAINGIGQLYSVENTDVTTVYDEYDAMGRVLSVSKTIAGDQERTIDTTYDKSGKVETIAYPDGFVVMNSYYPGTGLLHEVTGTMSGNTKSYAKCTGYEPTGKIRRIYHDYDGTDSVYNYDLLTTRLMDIQTSGGATESSSGSVFVQDRAYTYTKAGDIEEINDYRNGASYTYAYDNLHRLLSEASTGNVPAGPEVLIYTYNNADKPNAVRNINYNGTDYGFDYDANGNMRSGHDFTDPDNIVERDITWNADNMPVTVTRGSTSTTLTYDGDGARAKKAAGGTTTYYVSNDYEIKNGTATKYIFAGNLRVATVDNTGTYIFHKDHLGSSTAMTKKNGASFEIEETTEYLPFGGMRGHTGVEVTDYKFTDQERDDSTNLYNYDARLYDPVIGRFLSADPYLSPQLGNESNARFRLSNDEFIKRFSDPQLLSRYSYTRNNPLKYTDPSGLAEALIVILITDWTIDGDLEAWQNSSYGKNPNAIIYTGVDSIQKAGEILNNGDIKAVQVFISGEGSAEGGTMATKKEGPPGIDFNAVGFSNPDNAEGVKNMKSGVAKDARLTHMSCEAGKNPDDLQKTAKILDMNVRGWTGNVYPGPNPTGNPVDKNPHGNEEEKKKIDDKLIPHGLGRW